MEDKKLLTYSSSRSIELTKPESNHLASYKSQSQMSINETVERPDTEQVQLDSINVGDLDKVRFETEAVWQTHLGKAIALNY
jgi:hypothetical protein